MYLHLPLLQPPQLCKLCLVVDAVSRDRALLSFAGRAPIAEKYVVGLQAGHLPRTDCPCHFCPLYINASSWLALNIDGCVCCIVLGQLCSLWQG